MNNCDFIPNSPTLFNAGIPNGQLSACFVLPIRDSLTDIFDTLRQCALIFKSGGGVGMSYGEIRSKNSPVGESHGVASGAVSFMRVYDSAIEAIKAGGKRRGAAMGVLPCDHGDILDFIKCKSVEGQIKNFNLSVMMTPDFMNKVKAKNWTAVVTHTIRDDGTNQPITVGEIWKGIVNGSWSLGEPAVLFDDNINTANKLKKLGKIVSTNPCVTYETEILTDIGYVKIGDSIDKHVNVWNGESWSDVVPFFVAHNQQIYNVTFSNGSVVRCTSDHNWFTIKGKKTTLELNIGDKLEKCGYPISDIDNIELSVISIILSNKEDVYCLTEPIHHRFIANGVPTSNCGEQLLLPFESCNLGSINLSHYVKGNEIDFARLSNDTRLCTRFLNNVLDKNAFPIPELKEMNDKTRKIGLGIMGYHDMLLKLHIAYDSNEALNLLTKVLRVLFDSAKDESHKLALKYGVFPAFDDSEWDIPMRNGALTCVAPTGSISLLANCSSGIEPVFNWVYQRNNTVGKSFLMVHPLFDADLKTMCNGDSELYDEIINLVFHDGTLQNISMIPDKVKAVYKCALDISPEWHLKTLACAQKIVDASISKTINLPHHTTKSQVEKILIDAHDMGCKGVTVYRTGSRKDVVMASSTTSESGFVETIKDGKVYVKCPECGHLTLGHGGCNVCESCGFTKCS
jgi:ribonucleoside-diphosphate reductase alpha chain